MSILPAHLGHLGDVAGHDHWIAGGAIAAVGAAAVYGWLTRDKSKKKEEQAAEPETTEPTEGETA